MDNTREKLIELQREYFSGICASYNLADYLIANDVVPVVRCKDCKYSKSIGSFKYFCIKRSGVVEKDDFCSGGERKTEN